MEREEELQSLRSMLQNRHIGDLNLSKPAKPESLILHLVWPTFISSTTQPIRHVTGVSETLPTMSELSTNYLSVVSTTMSRVCGNVASTHPKPGLLSLVGTLRYLPQDPPDISLLVTLPFSMIVDVRSTTSQAPGLMSLPTSVVNSCPPLLSIAPDFSMSLVLHQYSTMGKLH